MAVVTRKLIINGSEQEVVAEPTRRLLDLLRSDLKLTGTKEGCGEGECGACSIILNDEVVDSCLLLFGQLADGDRLLTVEGLSGSQVPGFSGSNDDLHPLQRAFIDLGGTQCGMCTPGMLMAAYALLCRNPNPTREEIAVALAGNLCRCTGYVKIIDAVEGAAKRMREGAR